MMDKTEWFLLAELLEALFGKKKFLVSDIVDELRTNAKLTDEYKEAIVAEIQKRLGKNANLSKELIRNYVANAQECACKSCEMVA